MCIRDSANNDWTEVNGEHYYVKDGQALKECIEKIEDFYYGFNYKGVMYLSLIHISMVCIMP